jgi:hypothetical protein
MLLPGMSEEVAERRRAAYGDAITCINGLLLDAIDAVASSAPDTIVLLTADHGPDGAGQGWVPTDEWSPADFSERFGVFVAVHAPGCQPRPVDSPINAVRHVTDCALHTDLGHIARRAFFVPGEQSSGTIVDMSSRIP